MNNPLEAAGRNVIAGKAMAFSQLVACSALTGSMREAAALFAHRHPLSLYRDDVRKAAVAAGDTTDSTWAEPLAPISSLASAFIEYLRPMTVIGRMQGFRRPPFNIKAPRQTAGASVGWTGQGKPLLVTNPAFDSINFEPTKIGGIVVMSEELARSSDPDATALIRQDLASAVVSFSDLAFLDQERAEVSGVSPAAITNGATTVAATGTTASAFGVDFAALCALVTTNMTAPHLVMKPTTAISLAALDSHLTRNAKIVGGDIAGIPIVCSTNAPVDDATPALDTITLIDAAEVFLNEGSIEFDASKNTIVQMSNTPDSPATAATEVQSLWQHGLVGVLMKRWMRWERRHENSVAMLTGVNY